MTLLTADSVSKRFGGVHALDDARLTVTEGSITSLVGPNGCGKTTLVNCITGFIKPDAGTITLGGRDVTSASPRRHIRAGIRRTFQAVHLFEGMTVLDHLLLAQQEVDGAGWWAQVLRTPRLRRTTRDARARALAALELVELTRPPETVATALSYGQQKLLGLACALVSDPVLLCLDEPLAGVNPALAQRLVPVLTALRDRGVTLLIVEHNIEFVSAISDQVVVMADGAAVVDGPPSILREDPRVFAILSGTGEQP